MSTLITAAVLLAFALWAIGSYGRLLRLRRQVALQWHDVLALRKRRQGLTRADAVPADADGLDDLSRALEHAERLYNLVATKYNLAIASPSGSVIASAAGFKRAELIGRT
jgi:hypothetical protein